MKEKKMRFDEDDDAMKFELEDDGDDNDPLFLEDQEDLQLIHEGAIIHQNRREKLIRILMASNIIVCTAFLLLCLILLAFFGYKYYYYTTTPITIHECPVLKKYLDDSNSDHHKQHQLYFSDKFLSQMHSKIRNTFIEKIKQKLGDDTVLHFVGMTSDSNNHRQNRNFLYLFGVEYPEYEAIIDIRTKQFLLFVPKGDIKTDLVWNVRELESFDTIKERYGADIVCEMANLGNEISQLNRKQQYTIDSNGNVFITTVNITSGEISYNTSSVSFDSIFIEMRSVKTNEEITIMRKVIEISSYAHTQLKKVLSTIGDTRIWEFQIESYFRLLCQSCGLNVQAYEPIVATGPNAAVLHYILNKDRSSGPSDMLLIDAGAEFLGYASDITRTYPINAPYNAYQSKLYNAVATIQQRALNLVKPGANFTLIMRQTNKYMLEELISLGLINENRTVEEHYEQQIQKIFKPHGLGHLIGLDVHDTTVYPVTLLKSNMIISIEPGIYFNDFLLDTLSTTQKSLINLERVNEYRNANAFGVRIEEDILVTSGGYEILSISSKL
jgi:Xaa-Pro dipeptidase